MRTNNMLKNVFTNFLNNFLSYLLRFVSRIVFVRVLSEVYLGVNGLLSNVLGLLALTELGIGTAIGYTLYDPLAKKDDKKVLSLMKFYKKTYRIISLVIFVLGIILLPFLDFFIKDASVVSNLSIIYLIYLINMVIGYLYSYKRTLVVSDQKNYKIMPYIMFFSILTSILQIISLLIFKNYFVYLIIQTFCIILENIIINRFIDKEYPYLKDIESAKPLKKEELTKIRKNIFALIFHKIGSYVVNSTDNLVISKYIGIVTTGIYSNYVLIINIINSFFQMVVNNLIASFGNLISLEQEKKRFLVFKEINMLTFMFYSVVTVGFIILFNPVISLCFGSDLTLPFIVVLLISISNYIQGMTNTVITIQSSAGLYTKDAYVSIIQALVNIIISVILVNKIGLSGVVIGTIVCMLIQLINKPRIVYKNIFQENPFKYYLEFIIQSILIILDLIICSFLLKFLNQLPLIIYIILGIIIICLIVTLNNLLFYYKKEEFKNLLNRIKFLLKGRKNAKTSHINNVS